MKKSDTKKSVKKTTEKDSKSVKKAVSKSSEENKKVTKKTSRKTKDVAMESSNEPVVNVPESNNEDLFVNHKVKKHLYLSFSTRLITLIILFIAFFGSCLYFSSKTIERETLLPVPYVQKGNIDYKVYLNENVFYEKEYLEMNKAYIASLIKYIDVNYNYLFHIDSTTNMQFDYQILADLIIENSGGSKKYFEKTYTLLDSQSKIIQDNSDFTINENLKIDYNYYNNLANSFRSTYGVDTNSYLVVYLKVNTNTLPDANFTIDETNKYEFKIPLSERAIEIRMDTNNSEVTKYVVPEGKVIFSYKYLIIEIVLLIVSVVLFLKVVKKITLFAKTITPYDRYVNKLLKEYDRLIVEIHNSIDFNKYNVIKVKNFTELLDVRDNLKVPILYLCITKHEKGIFYIKNNEDIYLLTIKNIDLEK